MQRAFFTLLTLLLLHGCGNETYRLDGVKVVLVGGAGPSKSEMVLAVEMFRREAAAYWSLGLEDALDVWRSIREIRWRKDVLDSSYDVDTKQILLHWHKCVATSKLYWMLAYHYGGGEPHDKWAGQLVRNYAFLCDY